MGGACSFLPTFPKNTGGGARAVALEKGRLAVASGRRAIREGRERNGERTTASGVGSWPASTQVAGETLTVAPDAARGGLQRRRRSDRATFVTVEVVMQNRTDQQHEHVRAPIHNESAGRVSRRNTRKTEASVTPR